MELWILSLEIHTAIRVQILGETVYISHSANFIRKGMNPIILPPALGKQSEKLNSNLSMGADLGEGKF